MAIGLTFRASACGRYVCSIVGDTIRVLTVQEAFDLAGVYGALADDFLNKGDHAMHAHEHSTRLALVRAVNEATEIYPLNPARTA